PAHHSFPTRRSSDLLAIARRDRTGLPRRLAEALLEVLRQRQLDEEGHLLRAPHGLVLRLHPAEQAGQPNDLPGDRVPKEREVGCLAVTAANQPALRRIEDAKQLAQLATGPSRRQACQLALYFGCE